MHNQPQGLMLMPQSIPSLQKLFQTLFTQNMVCLNPRTAGVQNVLFTFDQLMFQIQNAIGEASQFRQPSCFTVAIDIMVSRADGPPLTLLSNA